MKAPTNVPFPVSVYDSPVHTVFEITVGGFNESVELIK
jgi:hypothetical protein